MAGQASTPPLLTPSFLLTISVQASEARCAGYLVSAHRQEEVRTCMDKRLCLHRFLSPFCSSLGENLLRISLLAASDPHSKLIYSSLYFFLFLCIY